MRKEQIPVACGIFCLIKFVVIAAVVVVAFRRIFFQNVWKCFFELIGKIRVVNKNSNILLLDTVVVRAEGRARVRFQTSVTPIGQ